VREGFDFLVHLQFCVNEIVQVLYMIHKSVSIEQRGTSNRQYIPTRNEYASTHQFRRRNRHTHK
jgi:hypothetical protein